ncbi:ribonuclease HI family protein [bacterium]|jgi:ribonuclease HI|nr:ribonuclease HI family protein [bacterium]
MGSGSAKKCELFVDGASRGNPGSAGAGVLILVDGKAVCEKGFFLGEKTNNQAEYLGLLIGLFYCKKYISDSDKLYIFSDSQLIVKQVLGLYRVKDQKLMRLYTVAKQALIDMNYSLKHILRDKNTRADALANKGVDEKKRLPLEFKTFLKQHANF